MNLIHSLLGRRWFLITFMTSVTLVFGGVSKAFDFVFGDSSARASEKPESAPKKPLKGCVVYYSAGGSTAKIAGAIYRGIKSVMDCDVSPVNKIDPRDMGKYDLVAVGCPIWFFRETANLRIFINKMPHMAGKLCILFCTHGTEPGGIFNSLSQTLRNKEFTIIGWNDWYGDTAYYIHAVQPYITYGHPDEIDLQEAEAFGKDMAERAAKIYTGVTNLIPEIPSTERLWVRAGAGGGGASSPGQGTNAAAGGPGGGGPMMPISQAIPVIDTAKCIYPRCTACMDNCIMNAIDLSIITPAGRISGSPIFIKGCISCGFPLCQRSCAYDAIIYKGQRNQYEFDMNKCTYPKCTLCIDHCGMKSIEFSQNTLIRHLNCEGCDLCWSICPENAIYLINLDDRMSSQQLIERLTQNKINMPKFRQLLPDGEWGYKGKALENPNAPRVVLNEADWPYEVDEG